MNGTSLNHLPENVGIKGFEFYFPRRYIEQTEFEKFNKEPAGKYLHGLGLKQMGFCDDNEDINSVALTVVSQLLERYNIDPITVGFLAVGTETTIDKSKSVKTTLMELFHSNHDIEGIDEKNGCYGGTQALFHAVDWVYSNYQYDGRFAIAVCADIAAYAPGPARCTGGAGAMAFLIGVNAPIVFERGLRSCYFDNVYDFYKPCAGLNCEFPTVDARLSLNAYLKSVDEGYKQFVERNRKIYKEEVNGDDFAAIIMHCPFYKMVQKGLARIFYQDAKAGRIEGPEAEAVVKAGKGLEEEKQYGNTDFLKIAASSAKSLLTSKVEPNVEFNQRIGNMYTPSMYAQLAAFLARSPADKQLNGKRILGFSYGSGSTSAFYSLKIDLDQAEQYNNYAVIQKAAKAAHERLEQRILVTPELYTEAMSRRQALTESEGPVKPVKADELFPGTYYLTEIDAQHRRYYNRV